MASKKKGGMLPFLGAVAVAGIYGFVNGKGLFNKPRFKEQHDAISRYVDSHYPGAVYSPIEATENGYMTVISRPRQPKILLYTEKTPDGVYVFNESPISQ